MASAKVVFYTSKKYKDGSSPVLLRVIIDRKPKYYTFKENFHCFQNQWDKKGNEFKSNYFNIETANESNNALTQALARAKSIFIKIVDEGKEITHDEFERRYNKKSTSIKLIDYCNTVINRLEKSGKVGNVSVYKTARNYIETYLKEKNKKSQGQKDIDMRSMSLKDLNLFVEHLISKGLKNSSISIQLRTIRALFNKAKKEEGLQNYPFEYFDWTKLKSKASKRAISKADVMKIINYQCKPGEEYFNDKMYFTFCYLTFGLNFSDLAKIKEENLITKNGTAILRYNRSKGGKLYEVPLQKGALEIIEHFRESNPKSKFIFPIINENIHVTQKQQKVRIQTALKKFNKNLNTLAKKLDITEHVTSYVTRHSFATILKNENVPISVISEMLGHSDERTTYNYLKEFEYSVFIDASSKLLD